MWSGAGYQQPQIINEQAAPFKGSESMFAAIQRVLNAEIRTRLHSKHRKIAKPLKTKVSNGDKPPTAAIHLAPRLSDKHRNAARRALGMPNTCFGLEQYSHWQVGSCALASLPPYGWQQTNCQPDLLVSLPAEQISSNTAGSLSGNYELKPCSAINGSTNLLCSFEAHRSIPSAWTIVLIWQMILL